MSEDDVRREAVRRRLAGEGPSEIAAGLGRTTGWVRKWVARHREESDKQAGASGHSRAPDNSPNRTREDLRRQILAARERLVANPRAQYGSLAIQWELRRLGVDPIPGPGTIERVLAQEGLTRPRRRQPGYVSKGVPYPGRTDVGVGAFHQVDMVDPRHLFGGPQFMPST